MNMGRFSHKITYTWANLLKKIKIDSLFFIEELNILLHFTKSIISIVYLAGLQLKLGNFIRPRFHFLGSPHFDFCNRLD